MILIAITVFLIGLSILVTIPALGIIINDKRPIYHPSASPYGSTPVYRSEVLKFDKVEAISEYIAHDGVPREYVVREMKDSFVDALMGKDFFKITERDSFKSPYVKEIKIEGRFAKMSQYDTL